MIDMKNHYQSLLKISKQAAVFGSMQQLLEWDQETYMPPGALEIRSQQLEALASLVHKQRTSSSFEKALSHLIDIETGAVLDQALSEAQIAALREWRRDFIRTKKLPPSFVKKFTKATSQALHAWARAKKQNSFKLFAPHFEKIVSLSRKKADLLGYREHPYDALLDLYEPEMTVQLLTPLFARLKVALVALLKDLTAKPIPPH